jgi:2-iminobutanoate/2-iminopropanoate deaminase
MKLLNSINAPKAIGPYSVAIKHNGLIYTSGQIALDVNANIVANDIEGQTKQVLHNLKAILSDNGSCMSNVIKVGIFMVNMDDFEVVNKIYAKAFGDHKPVRSTVAVKTLPKNVLIEMDIIALDASKA